MDQAVEMERVAERSSRRTIRKSLAAFSEHFCLRVAAMVVTLFSAWVPMLSTQRLGHKENPATGIANER